MSHMFATSRYIYDSETYKSMTNFYVNNFNDEIKKSYGMMKYFENPEPAAIDFKSMLNINIDTQYRESKLNKLSGRIKAISLKKDFVIPPESVLLTLRGINNNIPIDVLVKDFPFDYDHISPFPLGENLSNQVDDSFREVFSLASDFLK